MMRLKNSRGLFFSKTHEPQKSFWANPEMLSLVESANGKKVPQDLLDWDPCAEESRSNCPMLHDLLEGIVNMVDPRWQDRANNIYAGRTYSNTDTAQADKNLRGGMVAISNEFTTVLVAYSAMYGQFISSLDFSKEISAADAEAMWRGMHQDFNKSIDAFKLGGILALKGESVMTFPSEQFRQTVSDACTAAEAWSIAHELSHHLIRDMSARRDKGVDAVLRDLKSHSSLEQELRDMPPLHRGEIEADLLATLILSGHFIPQNRPPLAIHTAITAGALALITIAHLRDEWTADPTDSHPGCFDRLRILLTMMSEIYGNRSEYPDDPEHSHMLVYRLAGLLMTYGHWVKDLMNEIAESELPIQLGDSPPLYLIQAFYTTDFGFAADDYPG